MCAESVVGCDPFADLLADDFITDYKPGVTAELVHAFERIGNTQLSVMEVNGPDILKYGVVIPGGHSETIGGLVEKPEVTAAPSNLAWIGRYILSTEIFGLLRGLKTGFGGEI